MTPNEAASTELDQTGRFRRLLHDLAAPLSAVALHLEVASRRVTRGEDPSEPLATARRELERVFDLFERGRAEVLSAPRAMEGPATR